jgi:hypothetical protein
VRSGGVLLISDSSDSEEDDKSGTSDGMRPAVSEMEFEGAGGAAKACGWSVAPCATARVDLRF